MSTKSPNPDAIVRISMHGQATTYIRKPEVESIDVSEGSLDLLGYQHSLQELHDPDLVSKGGNEVQCDEGRTGGHREMSGRAPIPLVNFGHFSRCSFSDLWTSYATTKTPPLSTLGARRATCGFVLNSRTALERSICQLANSLDPCFDSFTHHRYTPS